MPSASFFIQVLFLREVGHHGRGPATLRQHTLEGHLWEDTEREPQLNSQPTASLQRSYVSYPLGHLSQLSPQKTAALADLQTMTASEFQVR